MPLYLRKFYLNEVKEAIERQNKANKGESEPTREKIHGPPGVKNQQ
tara:strand:+ start:910 stop:1047 length:138 start_codon:yes stop_codon:yes gene_type:complete